MDGPRKRRRESVYSADEERSKVENVDPRVPAHSSPGLAHPVRLGETHGLSRDGIQDIQVAFSDGAIYRKILMLKDQGAETPVNLWKARLSRSTWTCLKQLSKHEGFNSGLNALRDLPGLWDGLEVGSAQRILALRCDEVCFFALGFLTRKLINPGG